MDTWQGKNSDDRGRRVGKITGYGTAPEVSVPQQPQWINTPPPTQGYTTEQTWAQPTAPTPPPAAPVNVTVQVDTAPAVTDFGSAPPAFGDTPPAVDDPNRPLRRPRK